MIRSLCYALTTAPLFAACLDAGPPDLADLSNVAVNVRALHPYDEVSGRDAPAHLTIELDARRAGDASACPVALTSAVTATFNDVPLVMTRRGGVGNEDECVPPRFEGDIALTIDGPRKLRISDASHTIDASYKLGDLSPRHAILLSHDVWTFAPGEIVAFGWSHPQDQVLPRFEVWLEQIESPQTATLVERDDVQAVDETISVRLPSPPPRTGEMLMNIISLGGYVPQSGTAETCVGADMCTFSTPLGYRHLLTITQ